MLAQHFTEAGLAQKAVGYWLEAGRLARQRCGHQEAIRHLQAGKSLLSKVTEETARIRLEIELETSLGFAFIETKGYAALQVEAAFSRACELCQTIAETSLAVPALRGLTTFYWARSDLPAARSLGLQLIQIAERTADVDLLLVAHGMVAGILSHIGEFSTSEAHLRELQIDGDPGQRRRILVRFGADTPGFTWTYHGYNLAWLGHVDEALVIVNDAVESARRIGHPSSIANALCRAAVCPAILRDPVMASTFAEHGLAIAQELGLPVWVAAARIVLGWASAMRGRVEGSVSQINDGLKLWRSTGAFALLPLFFSFLSDATLAGGNIDGAIAAADEGREWSARKSEHAWECLLHCSRGNALTVSGATAEAEADYSKAMAWSRERSAKWGELHAGIRLARLWRSSGEAARAYELLAPIYGWFTEGFGTKDLIEAKALLDELGAALGRSPVAMKGTSA